jgi:hypothetical protein
MVRVVITADPEDNRVICSVKTFWRIVQLCLTYCTKFIIFTISYKTLNSLWVINFRGIVSSMIAGLETNLALWQFLLLLIIFVGVLALAYYLVSVLSRQATKRRGTNWNMVIALVILLPPILGLGAVLGISMFSFFAGQLQTAGDVAQERTFIRDLVPREQQLISVLRSGDSEEGLYQFRQLLVELEQGDIDRTNLEIWRTYERLNRGYMFLLFMAGKYQEIVRWENERFTRFPNLEAFPALMAVSTEVMGKDGSFWTDYLVATSLEKPAIGFMRGFLARQYGSPDSALMYLDKYQVHVGAVDFMSVAFTGERVKALTDLGRYDQARDVVIQQLEPLLLESDYPLLASYVLTTRCYLELQYYLSLEKSNWQGIRSLKPMDFIEENLLRAIETNRDYCEPRVLLAFYYSLTDDAEKSSFYFNDAKARFPWIVPATNRFLAKMQEPAAVAATDIRFMVVKRIVAGLQG